MVRIEHDAHLQPYVETANRLFLEYSRWIERSFGITLEFQGFEREMAEFPGVYSPPGGRLLLAMVGGEGAGCSVVVKSMAAPFPMTCGSATCI